MGLMVQSLDSSRRALWEANKNLSVLEAEYELEVLRVEVFRQWRNHSEDELKSLIVSLGSIKREQFPARTGVKATKFSLRVNPPVILDDYSLES